MELKFTSYAWEDYKYWEKQDSRTLKKINALIDSLLREPGASGIGKSERLSGNLSGWAPSESTPGTAWSTDLKASAFCA